MALLCCCISCAQIVNIETARLQNDTTGWMGSLKGDFALTKNTGSVIQADGFAHVQYKTPHNLYLLLGNYSLVKASGQQLVDNGFLHFRYNRKLNDMVRWEAFTQLQNDVITKIYLRWLAGTGPRFKAAETKQLKLFAASLAMYEFEKETSSAGIIEHKDVRSSSYLSLTWKPASNLELISTTFYQPLFKNFKDFRILNQDQFRLSVTHKLSLTLDWNYLFDQYPAEGVPKTNYTFTTGVSYDL